MDANFSFQHLPFMTFRAFVDIDKLKQKNYLCDSTPSEMIETIATRKSNHEKNLQTCCNLEVEEHMSNPYGIHWIEQYFSKYKSAEEFEDLNYEDIGDTDGVTEILLPLNRNPNAVEFLRRRPDFIRWTYFSKNPNAIDMIEANLDKVDWKSLCKNPNAIHLLEANPDKIDWRALSANPNAIHLLEANPAKIDWWALSANPNAIRLLEAHLDKIKWVYLSMNTNATALFEEFPEKIKYGQLRFGPNLLTYNYKKIKSDRMPIMEEVVKYCFQPRMIQKWLEAGNDIEDYLM